MVSHRDIIVVGASAGGVEALRALMAGLPPDLKAAVLVVLHLPRDAASALPAILSRSGPLPAEHAVDGRSPRYGRIDVAPVDRHMLLLGGRIRLSRGPTENGHRPAIDPLFRSAARSYGSRVLGVVLSGARDDGAAGLAAIVQRGGVALVQEPTDALHPSMPVAAAEQAGTVRMAPAAALGPVLAELVAAPLVDPPPIGDDPVMSEEVAIADLLPVAPSEVPERPAGFGCPACGGVLFELPGTTVPRYRCRVGHAWSAQSLLAEHEMAMEGALWMALRALEERSALSLRMADNRSARGNPAAAKRYRALAREAESAAMIRKLIESVTESVSTGQAVAEAGPVGA
jgi:two-component system chemotaxis response regulator CheB